jgi:hypothetical protein
MRASRRRRGRARARGQSAALRPIIAIRQRDKSKPARMKIRAGRFDRRGGGWGRFARADRNFFPDGEGSFLEMMQLWLRRCSGG